MPVNIAPLEVSSEDIKKMLSESGVNTLDELIDGIRAVAGTEKQSGGIGKITPYASWVLKFFRLD
jgi:hypothetical protein